MTLTTIKVTTDLRDHLKAQAAAQGRTLSEHLSALAEEEDRRERFRAVRRAMAERPADETYEAEASDWASDAWN